MASKKECTAKKNNNKKSDQKKRKKTKLEERGTTKIKIHCGNTGTTFRENTNRHIYPIKRNIPSTTPCQNMMKKTSYKQKSLHI